MEEPQDPESPLIDERKDPGIRGIFRKTPVLITDPEPSDSCEIHQYTPGNDSSNVNDEIWMSMFNSIKTLKGLITEQKNLRKILTSVLGEIPKIRFSSFSQIIEHYNTSILRPQENSPIISPDNTFPQTSIIEQMIALYNTYIQNYNYLKKPLSEEDGRKHIEYIKHFYFYFTAIYSSYMSETYIVQPDAYNNIKNLNGQPLQYKGSQVAIVVKSENPKFPLWKLKEKSYYQNLCIYVNDLFLLEFYFADTTLFTSFIGEQNEILTNINPTTYQINPDVLSTSLYQSKYLAAGKLGLPYSASLDFIFSGIKNSMTHEKISSIFNNTDGNCNHIEGYANAVYSFDDLYDVDFFCETPSYGVEKNNDVCSYKLNSDNHMEYNDFTDHMNSNETEDKKQQYGPIKLSKFKKYFENYIVNYCHFNCPSLKIIVFNKITALNKFMVENDWGFVDVAGGSLFNYITSSSTDNNVITADYDFKIYFYDTPNVKPNLEPNVEPINNVREYRKTVIKLWYMNISHIINEYLRTNHILEDFKVSGNIGVPNPDVYHVHDSETGIPISNPILSYEISPIPKRYFTSRGKEPPFFPVSLYSDDLLFNFTIRDKNNEKCSANLKFNVSYFDLVFKDFEDHYIYKCFKESGDKTVMYEKIFDGFYFNSSPNPVDNSHKLSDINEELGKLRENFVDLRIQQTSDLKILFNTALEFALVNKTCYYFFRVPLFYEICKDVRSLSTVAVYLLPRICAGKVHKDAARILILLDHIRTKISNSMDDNKDDKKDDKKDYITNSINDFMGKLVTYEDINNVVTSLPSSSHISIIASLPHGTQNYINASLTQPPMESDNSKEQKAHNLVIESATKILEQQGASFIDEPKNNNLLFSIPMEHTLSHIDKCYYQFNLYSTFCNNELISKIRDNPPFDPPQDSPLLGASKSLNIVTKLYAYMVLNRSKYSELKDKTDMERLPEINDFSLPVNSDIPTTNNPDFNKKILKIFENKINLYGQKKDSEKYKTFFQTINSYSYYIPIKVTSEKDGKKRKKGGRNKLATRKRPRKKSSKSISTKNRRKNKTPKKTTKTKKFKKQKQRRRTSRRK